MLMESLTRSYRKEEKIDGGRGEAGTMAQERWPNSNGFLDYRLIIDRDPVVRPKVRIWKAFSEKGDRLSSYFGVCVRVCVCVCVCVCVSEVSRSCWQDWCHHRISSCVLWASLPFTFLSPASSKVSGVVLNCINMQEFIDCLPWHFCREGKRVLQSPSALITGSWQCYLSLVKDKPRHRAERAQLLGSLQERGMSPGRFYSHMFDVLGALTTIKKKIKK